MLAVTMMVDMFFGCKKMVFGVMIVAFAGCFACNYKTDIPIDFPTPEPSPAATPLAKMEFKIDAELEKQFAKIAEDAKGKVGVAAVVIEIGEAAFLNADQRFPMQSVYKLPIAMAVMEQVRLGEIDLDEKVGVTKDDMVREGMRSPLRDQNPNGGEFTIRELIRLALVESDGTASDVLLRLVPPAEVQSYLTQIGVRDMKVVNTEKELGHDWQTQYENWSTPVASIDLLRWLWATQRAEVSDRPDPKNTSKNCLTGYNLIYCNMIGSTTGPKRLKRLAEGIALKDWPPTIAHKTGTSGTRNKITAATNDIGLILIHGHTRIAIAVYVSDSPADEKTREAVIAKIAKAAWDRWNKN